MSASAFDGPLGPSLLKIIRGAPSAEELAAVTALVTALSSAARAEADGEPEPEPADWNRATTFSQVSWMAAGHRAGR
ncbi:acyl-CoA carboxylase subunit epsilon [Streptomyces sp. SID14515]|uniref:acyl-CoA carboxylase subunit epsilon n=1 Tax=Streptomyces sp. SID14515 TaxID=2706074 RepID=UPI0013CC1B4E|nr:acyl-CoA carboxylase subunit epsilon [Streptomyces sp. SID14515]NEB42205.1 acyl-CoA carboxylase subunit epsilon [Streptomyces sp. SID14515]